MDKKVVGLIGIITILSSLLGVLYLSEDELDNAYICLATEEVGIFYGGVSSTGLTAYPYLENRTNYKRCYSASGGKSSWVTLTDYIKENNISISEILNKEEINIDIAQDKYRCDINECYKFI